MLGGQRGCFFPTTNVRTARSMRIGQPEVVVDAESVTLQARITFAHRREDFPDRLWFRYPRALESFLRPTAEPFVVALSSLASALGEPIDVSLPISERLSVGLEEYWTIFNRWDPYRFRPVALNCAGYTAETPVTARAGAAFSGGVDSLFTLFRWRKDQAARPTHQIEYGLFIHGFDIPLADERTYSVAAAAYEEALGRCGVQLVRVATNVRQFVDFA